MAGHKVLKIARANVHLQNILRKELGISAVLAQILINRGINSSAGAERFLRVKLEHLHDPYTFSDMHKAVLLIKKAAENKERVMLFGDYDVDGITSIVLLKETLASLGIEAEHHLPHRIREGYGLNKDTLRLAKEKKIKLLITADCGISNHKEIEELRRNNIEVIVTDHHEPSSVSLPQASSIINPKVKSSGYAFRELAGVGVAYKLCQALAGSALSDSLDLVTLGTIADSVALTGENRVIAKEGLKRLPKTKRPGLRALIENAGIKDKKFTATFVSFILAPRINACGRMDTAQTSLDLLMSRTQEEAGELAKVIEAHNRQRQKIEGKILEEAEDMINRDINFKEHRVIVIAKEDWHQGVLGIVASKIADRFYRPAVVISLSQNLCKGSCRSIKSFHLFDALLECKDFLNSFGGHAHAAGILIAKDNIDEFRKNINRLAQEKLSFDDLLPSIDIDMELSFGDLNEELIAGLEALEPFGQGNPEPLFYTRSLRLKSEPQVLNRQTIKFWATDGQVTFEAIGFGMSGLKDNFNSGNSFDLVYTPRMDNWRDEPSVLLEIRDVFFR